MTNCHLHRYMHPKEKARKTRGTAPPAPVPQAAEDGATAPDQALLQDIPSPFPCWDGRPSAPWSWSPLPRGLPIEHHETSAVKALEGTFLFPSHPWSYGQCYQRPSNSSPLVYRGPFTGNVKRSLKVSTPSFCGLLPLLGIQMTGRKYTKTKLLL